MTAQFQEREDLATGNGRVNGQEVVDTFSGFEKIDERLYRNARICEAGGSVHDFFVDRNHILQLVLLFRRHRYQFIVDQADETPVKLCN
jgi:hypothetical protein